EWVGHGPVKHCIHAAWQVSQAWLHVHTICAEGGVDGMHSTADFAWCGVMNEEGEADALGAQVQEWILKGAQPPPRPSEFCKERPALADCFRSPEPPGIQVGAAFLSIQAEQVPGPAAEPASAPADEASEITVTLTKTGDQKLGLDIHTGSLTPRATRR
ncbi:unnamed protein product, partial [Prorocentrum cordatum]